MAPFILFEGIEGCGKTTQSKALYRRLHRQGKRPRLVREPGSTAVGNAARRILKHKLDVDIDPLTELFLFAAARAQLVAQVIRPALAHDRIIICDRFGESTLAYQGYGRGIDLDAIRTVNAIATAGLRPDLIILLDLHEKAGLDRKGTHTSTDRFEREEMDFHRRVRHGYLEMARSDPARWMVLDATQPKREIAAAVADRVGTLLPPIHSA